MEKFEILKELVKFNTIKDKENEKIVNYIESILKNYGFKTLKKDKVLVMANSEDCEIGFLGHTDTVEYVDGWNSNPLEMTIKDDVIYGLGVCDMKGGDAAIIDAVINTDFSKLKKGIKLYFTYDEEIGFGGIYDLLKANEVFPKMMVFGEATNNELLVGSKGLFELELNFKGIKAHASNPSKGKSANINAVKALYELNEYYENNIKPETNDKYEIPYTSMNVGIIKGGTGKNSIPGECFVTLDFRPVDKNHSEMILSKLDELKDKYDFEYKVFEKVNPFYNDIEGASGKTTNFITEASLVNDSCRIILGPGPITQHEINEHITVESYELLVKQYKELIEKYCK